MTTDDLGPVGWNVARALIAAERGGGAALLQLASQHRPGLLERHQLHAVEDFVGHLGPPVSEALAFPFARKKLELGLGDLLPERGCAGHQGQH